MITLITQEWNVRAPDSYIPQMKPADLGVYLTRVQGRRATTPPAATVFAQHRASAAVPAPRDEELTDRQKAIAYARSQVGVNQRAAIRPAPSAPPPPLDPAAEAARAELLQGGDFDQWMTAAYDKLDEDVHRGEVVILAAALRRTATIASGSPL
ncbi:hypothetical protein [Streptosporangium sp. NPDC004631]